MTKTTDFAGVFTRLRAILVRHAGALTVTEDRPRCYRLEGGRHPKHGTPVSVAWVQVGKAYVSFHHMGIYVRPDLLVGVSQELRARMQGKSCFNFVAIDQAQFAELEALAGRAFAALRQSPLAVSTRRQGRSDRLTRPARPTAG